MPCIIIIIIVYSYLEFKLRYLKNLKLFLMRVKELFEPVVLQKKKKKKGDGFLFFLKTFSWETDLFLRWFYSKIRKIRKGNLYFTENQLGRNEMWYAEDNHSYMCHIWAKGFLD